MRNLGRKDLAIASLCNLFLPKGKYCGPTPSNIRKADNVGACWGLMTLMQLIESKLTFQLSASALSGFAKQTPDNLTNDNAVSLTGSGFFRV